MPRTISWPILPARHSVAALLALPWLVACAAPARVRLDQAEKLLTAGRTAEACAIFDDVATRSRVGPADRATALIRAAYAADRLGDQRGALVRLEQAVLLDAPGAVEAAYYYLAERLTASDRARGLSLDYSA